MTDTTTTNPTTEAKRTRTMSTATAIEINERRKQVLSDELAQVTNTLTDLYAKRDAEDAAAAARTPIEVDGLPAGTKVNYSYGRKDEATTYTGEVLGFRPKTDKTPAAYRIMFGSGIEAELHTVTANNVLEVVA